MIAPYKSIHGYAVKLPRRKGLCGALSTPETSVTVQREAGAMSRRNA